jgi:hypothetical protein
LACAYDAELKDFKTETKLHQRITLRPFSKLENGNNLENLISPERPILNFDPRGEFCPLGVKFSVFPTILLKQ